jgi:hypothetical protein
MLAIWRPARIERCGLTGDEYGLGRQMINASQAGTRLFPSRLCAFYF